MKASIEQVRADFDRIALSTEQRGAPDTYHNLLLSHLPLRCESALEIGCGTGIFTRRLAATTKRVTGLDLSPQMLRLAIERSIDYPNIEYLLGDLMQLALPKDAFDCVVSIATLHHLPTEQALTKMKNVLAPGGRLIIHDLVADDGLLDMCRSVVAKPFSVALRFLKTGRLLPPREVRKAWNEHARSDVYLTLSEVKELCAQLLPEARIQRHFLWRYTIVWQRPLS
ncbi:MAG TPA: class I SAM-dependent methyltransferase [Pyrinomonadaceae bacterium]